MEFIKTFTVANNRYSFRFKKIYLEVPYDFLEAW